MRLIFLLFAMIALFDFSSCRKDTEDPAYCSEDWATNEENALYAAYSAYAADMSVANCNALKTACQNYINALEPFLECVKTWTDAERQEVQDTIDETKNYMNQLICQ